MTPRVLYFDDEVVCLDTLRDMLSDHYEVRTAVTLAEAHRLLDAQSFDIIISDLCMPEIDGLTFLREVAEKHPTSCRVVLTGTITVGELDVHTFECRSPESAHCLIRKRDTYGASLFLYLLCVFPT